MQDREHYDEFDDFIPVDIDAYAFSTDQTLVTDGIYCCIATAIRTDHGHLLTHTPPDLEETAPHVYAAAFFFDQPVEGEALHVLGTHTSYEDLAIVQETLDQIDGLDIDQYIEEADQAGSLAVDEHGFYRYDPSIRYNGSHSI